MTALQLHRPPMTFAALITLGVLAACGGGGDDTSTPASPAAAASEPAVSASTPVAEVSTSPVTSTGTTAPSTEAAPAPATVVAEAPTAPSTANTGSTSGTGSTPTVSVQSTDVLVASRYDVPLADRPGNLQCMGAYPKLSALTGSVWAPGVDGSPELKYGWVPDPAGSDRPVTYFAIRETDPDTAGTGNKRCEHAYYNAPQLIPWDQDFWFAVSVRTGSLTGTTDHQIIWQWHEGSSTSGLSPYLAAAVTGNKLSISLRSNQNAVLTSASTTVIGLLTRNDWTANTWRKFVVKARLNTVNNASSTIKIWLDGTQVVDYTGPVGYLYEAPKDYVKTGLYHWTNSGNAWSPAQPKREAWFKGPALVMGRPGYTPQSIDEVLR